MEPKQDTEKRLLVFMSQLGVGANGGTRSLTNIITSFPANVRVELVTNRSTSLNQELAEQGVKIRIWRHFPENWLGKRLNMVFLNLRTFFFVLLYRFDAVHLNDLKFLLNTSFGLRLAGVAPTFNVRDTNEKNRPYKRHWKLLAWCHEVITLSREMTQDLRARLPLSEAFKSRYINHIYSIVNFNQFYPLSVSAKEECKHSLGYDLADFLIVVVAKVDPKKQQLKLLEAARDHLPSNRRLKVLFVGDVEKDEYGLACLKLGDSPEIADQVAFVGYQSSVVKYYQGADLVLVPSQREGLARCMIEGLACGTPVVSFSVSSAREILEGGQCGLVVEQGDYSGLFAAISDLFQQPEQRKEMGENGYQLTRRLFDASKVTKRYYEVFFFGNKFN